MVLLCDYDMGTVPPEMNKKRPVIIVSRYQINKHGLCTIVPMSTVPPRRIEYHHYQLDPAKYLFLHPSKESWVKCDMVRRVSFERLDRIRIRGRYGVPSLNETDVNEIVKRVLANFPKPLT